MEAQEKYLSWRCELEGEMEKQSDSQGEGNARKYETKEGSSYYSQNPPRRYPNSVYTQAGLQGD